MGGKNGMAEDVVFGVATEVDVVKVEDVDEVGGESRECNILLRWGYAIVEGG